MSDCEELAIKGVDPKPLKLSYHQYSSSHRERGVSMTDATVTTIGLPTDSFQPIHPVFNFLINWSVNTSFHKN